MMEDFLYSRLDRVAARERQARVGSQLAACWAAAALVGAGFILLQRELGWASRLTWPLLAACTVGVSIFLVQQSRRRAANYRALAARIEGAHPELQGVLLTAVQQPRVEGKEPGYLQYRVIQTAIASSQASDWRDIVPRSRLTSIYLAQLAALVVLVGVLWSLRVTSAQGGELRMPLAGVTVTPGNIDLERGESLIVTARFGGSLPAAVELVVSEDQAATRKQTLVKSLADPIFGGSVPEVKANLVYHLEYGGKRTPDYKVKVFEHPRLERANVDLTFPEYTHQPPKRIEDTRRVNAVEGSKLGLALQLNKPVKSAKLVAHNKEKTTIDLQVAPDKATALLPELPLVASQTYDLKLVDDVGRANKGTTTFVIEVAPNRPPEIKLTSPRGDTRPSAIEEVVFEGTVWDDFGSPAFGMTYTVAGGETKSIQLGKDTPAKEKQTFSHVLRLEELGVQPDQLLSWYVWADDIGPDGKLRRTSGDLFFGEVRPFDEIFRESQDMMSADQQQQQQQGGGGSPARKLTELQKQIISATWKLQRDAVTPKYADDASVVHQSQDTAIEQATEAASKANDPRTQALWKAATTQMEAASEKLKDAAKSQAPLAQALSAEQSAYQSLLKLQEREYNVNRSKNRGGGGGQGGNQRQIDQLDLAQAENRYETQKQASPPQSPERREQSQVMNRLQELAHRQGDLNDRMKELQTALQEARTEQQKEEIQRQLKRLQEEQRQMLADLDELKQRMDRPENQSRMTEQRKQLDQTRDQIQQAADAAGSGSVAQAVSAGTRAQRQLQDMRDELRKQNSSQFAEDLRQMRSDARELARQQEEISRQMGTANNEGPQRKSLASSPQDKNVLDQLNQQKDRMKDLVGRATEVSQQAENVEPLVSKQLYDSIRKLNQDDVKTVKDFRRDLLDQGMLTRSMDTRLQESAGNEESGKTLDLTKDLLTAGLLPQAGEAERRARSGIDDLRRGVEKAAGSVLGDDAEALKMAQSEIDAVTDQLQKEIAQDQGGGKPGKAGDASAGANGNGARSANGQRLAGQGEQDGNQKGQAPGARGQSGDQAEKSAAGGDLAAGEQDSNGDQKGAQPGDRPGGNGQQRGQRPGQAGDPRLADQGQAQPGGGQTPSGEQGEKGSGGQQGQNGQETPSSNSGQPGSSGSSGQGGQQVASNGSSSPSAENPGSDQTPGADQNAGAQQNGANPGERQGGNRAGDRQARNGGPRQLAGGQRGGQTGDQRGGFDVNNVFNGGDAGGGGGAFNWNGELGNFRGPILSDNYGLWADRLRNVEDVLDDPALREAVAAARERARQMRVDFRRDQKKPDWAVVQLQVVKPLIEVRNRIAEELARRDSKDSLVPIDRDPVPNRYTDSVAKYYESLGKDKPGTQ